MRDFSQEMRAFVYSVICFQGLLQLTSGSCYHKYVKLLVRLITLCICCNLIFSLTQQIKLDSAYTQEQYAVWLKQWEQLEKEGEYK